MFTAKRNTSVYSAASRKDMAQRYLKSDGEAEQRTQLNRDLLSSRQIADVEAFTSLSFDGL